MNRKILRTAQICLAFVAFVCVGFLCYRQWAAAQKPPRFDWHHLPKEGYTFHDTNGDVPGDVENGVQGLKKLYGVIQIYRKRHDGEYPAKTIEIISDCIHEPGAYGVKNYKELMDNFYNPDNQFGDDSFRRPNHMMTVSAVGTRPDGTPIGGPKSAGTRDLVGMSSLYFHQNVRIYSEAHGTENPVGWYLLLWDDGTVEKLPYDKVLYVETAPKTWQMAFPGQAGLPAKGVSTYDEWYQLMGWKAGPRGVRGGQGADGRTYNPKSGG